MTRRIAFTLTFSLLMMTFVASSVYSARKAPPRTQYNRLIRVIYDAALPWENNVTTGVAEYHKPQAPQASLGSSGPSTSPGAEMGTSYYDYQGNTYQGRMIRVGTHDDGGPITLVHSAWMDLAGPDLENVRGPAYAFYDALSGVYQTEVDLCFNPEYAGYINLDITNDNRAVICGHYRASGGAENYSPALWYDAAPGLSSFDCKAIVPIALTDVDNPYTGEDARVVWCHVAVHYKPGDTEVTHLTGLTFSGGSAQHILYYFRKETAPGADCDVGLTGCPSPSDPTWECPMIYDTAQATVAGVEASDQSGKVALFWVANFPEAGCRTPPNDICSINDDLGAINNRFINDAYYQTSDDYGVTWNDRVNITKHYSDSATAEWLPWNDIDGLWTGDARAEEFHMAWSAWDFRAYREEGAVYYRSRVYHWAESFGVGPDAARPAMQSRQDPIQCNAGAFNQNLSKINIASCDNKIYITAVDLWDGHDDPNNPDCSERGLGGDFSGAVNGELMVVISDNNGVSFDLQHNLTNSPTPNCDTLGATIPCDADHWPSMTPHGHATDLSSEDWSLVTSVIPEKDPPVAYPDGNGVEWLHIQYVNDLDPGSVLFDNSTWQDNPIRHFRMACVEPDQIPVLNLNITEINWPTFVKPDSTKDITVVVENTGNAPLNYSANADPDGGPVDWLTVSTYLTPLPDGSGNKDTGAVTLDADGLSSGDVLTGRILFPSDAPTIVDTLPVTMFVEDSIVNLEWDTINTGVISLAVSNTGQFGGGGNAGVANVRMDYFDDPMECDTETAIPGDTRYYLYDGGFIAGGIVDTGGGLDTLFSNQIFGQGFRNEWSVYPLLGGATVVDTGLVYFWKSPKMVSGDSTLQFRVTWFAPQVTDSFWTFNPATKRYLDQQFVTRRLVVAPNDGQAHTGLAVGDAIDWDIPSDSGSDNSGTADASRHLVYCIGAEYNQDDTADDGSPLECQDNDRRFGGEALGWIAHWKTLGGPRRWYPDNVSGGGYIESNARYVYQGWDAGELYVNMETYSSTWQGWTHANPDSQETDLHAVVTAAFDFDLAVGESLAVYTVYASVRDGDASRMEDLADKGRSFTKYWGCCEGRAGDFNGDNGGFAGPIADPNVLDINMGVNIFYRLTLPLDAVPCLGEGDANRNGSFNAGDVAVLINRSFRQNDQVKHCAEGG